jgi:uncharacterized protein with HEPN domain
MKDDTLAHLHDASEACCAIKRFIEGRTFQDYASDELFRSAIERKFEIAGEALSRIRRDDPSVLESIRDHREIISFRNILIHGYDSIDNRIVWDVIQQDLDRLVTDLKSSL